MDKRQDERKRTGAEGEQIAEQYLRDHGYVILERNWRCRTGELDIIAEMDQILIFVEVRSRKWTGSYGTAKESVRVSKQLQVRETAQFYIHRYRKYDQSMRFDVITVEWTKGEESPLLEHIKGAF